MKSRLFFHGSKILPLLWQRQDHGQNFVLLSWLKAKLLEEGRTVTCPRPPHCYKTVGDGRKAEKIRPLKLRGRAYLRRRLQQNRETSLPRPRFATNNKQQPSTAGVASEAETLSSVTPHVRPAQNWWGRDQALQQARLHLELEGAMVPPLRDPESSPPWLAIAENCH